MYWDSVVKYFRKIAREKYVDIFVGRTLSFAKQPRRLLIYLCPDTIYFLRMPLSDKWHDIFIFYYLTWKYISNIVFAQCFLSTLTRTKLWPRHNMLFLYNFELELQVSISQQTAVQRLSASTIFYIINTFEIFGKVRKLWTVSRLLASKLTFVRRPQFKTFMIFTEAIYLVFQEARV